jgi:hypothetical protein
MSFFDTSLDRAVIQVIPRVYALYKKNRVVGLLLALYLTAELSVALWIYCMPGSHRESQLYLDVITIQNALP